MEMPYTSIFMACCVLSYTTQLVTSLAIDHLGLCLCRVVGDRHLK